MGENSSLLLRSSASVDRSVDDSSLIPSKSVTQGVAASRFGLCGGSAVIATDTPDALLNAFIVELRGYLTNREKGYTSDRVSAKSKALKVVKTQAVKEMIALLEGKPTEIPVDSMSALANKSLGNIVALNTRGAHCFSPEVQKVLAEISQLRNSVPTRGAGHQG